MLVRYVVVLFLNLVLKFQNFFKITREKIWFLFAKKMLKTKTSTRL